MQEEEKTPMIDRERMRKQLNETHTWPCEYMFKFVVSNANENEATLRAIFGVKAKLSFRDSKTGKYRSFTIKCRVENADEIFSKYEAAAKIPGIISLQIASRDKLAAFR